MQPPDDDVVDDIADVVDLISEARGSDDLRDPRGEAPKPPSAPPAVLS